MSEASGGHETGTTESTTGGNVTNQLAILVPTFDPAKDDRFTSKRLLCCLKHGPQTSTLNWQLASF